MTLMTEKQEKQILMISFCSGLLFAIAEFIFAIYSRSQSALTDAMYDLSELVFIALLIFLTPLFHKPVSEKHPYGYFQVESVFVIIKGIMMLSVTMGVSAGVIESVLSGGSRVDHDLVAEFQCILGAASLVIYLGMKRLSRELFLFSPEQSHIAQIKAQCAPILAQYRFEPVFYDVTKTGRHLWVAVYFHVQGESLALRDLEDALHQANQALQACFSECTCELILLP